MSASQADLSARPGPFALALKRLRTARRMSQLELALTCDVSPRHLTFLESGRARPSREMVLILAEGLLAPLAARNALVQAAGFAAAYPASPLQSEALAAFRGVLTEMIDRHAPNPALLVDRCWNMIDANAPARRLLGRLGVGDGQSNIIRALIARPDAVGNLAEVLDELAMRLQLEALEAGDDPELGSLAALIAETRARLPDRPRVAMRQAVVPLVFNLPGGAPLRFLTAIAHFGTSEDVTIRDLRLELLFPADDPTRLAMQHLSGVGGGS